MGGWSLLRGGAGKTAMKTTTKGVAEGATKTTGKGIAKGAVKGTEKSLGGRVVSGTLKYTKKTFKLLGKGVNKLVKGVGLATVAALSLLKDNKDQQEQEHEQQQNSGGQIPGSHSNVNTPGQFINDNEDKVGESQLELEKGKAKLGADEANKVAQVSKSTQSTINKAQSVISTALSDLQSQGIVKSKINDTLTKVVIKQDTPTKLSSEVEREVKTTGGLGVKSLQALFGKVDGVKDAVVSVGQMLYSAQDITIKQNKEKIDRLIELQKSLISTGEIIGADANINAEDSRLDITKDQIAADAARKEKSAADKAYEEATNANAEAKTTSEKVKQIFDQKRLAGVQETAKKSKGLNKFGKLLAGAAGIAALVGGLKNLLDGKDDDLDKLDDSDDIDEPGSGIENGVTSSQGQEFDGVNNANDHLIQHSIDAGSNAQQAIKDRIKTPEVENAKTPTEETPKGSDNKSEDKSNKKDDKKGSKKEGKKGGKKTSKVPPRKSPKATPLNKKPAVKSPVTSAVKAETSASETAAEAISLGLQDSKFLKLAKVAKTVFKRVPVLGTAFDALNVKNRLDAGDDTGAAISAASSLLYLGGPYGMMAGLMLDAIEADRQSKRQHMLKLYEDLIAKQMEDPSSAFNKINARMGDNSPFVWIDEAYGGSKNVPLLSESDRFDHSQALASLISAYGGSSTGISDPNFFNGYTTENTGKVAMGYDTIAHRLRQLGIEIGVNPKVINRSGKDDRGGYRSYKVTGDPDQAFTFIKRTDDSKNGRSWSEVQSSNTQKYNEIRANINKDPNIVEKIGNSIVEGISGLGDKVAGLLGFSNGGLVPGNPSDGDSVPAMLQPGEFVLPTQLVDQIIAMIKERDDADRGGLKPLTLSSPKVTTHPRVIKPSLKPPVVRDTSLNPKDFENAVENKNFDIASAVGVANELPNYDLASGEDSNKTKDPLEASVRGICARYIRAALEAGGINTQSHPGEAYEYAKWLPNQGFREVDNNSKLLPGDISVEGKTDLSPHGHIAMWTGTQWVSDKFQNSRVVTPPGKHGTLVLLRHKSMPLTEPNDNTDYGKDDYDYGVDNSTGASALEMQGMLDKLPNNVQQLIASSPQSQQDFVNKMRTLLVDTMRTKKFINPDDLESYADIMVAQVANETGWGKHIPGGGRSNNWSGMTPNTTRTPRASTGNIKSSGTGDTNKYVIFNSVNDWADEFVEYLNRKWKAFDKGPSMYLEQLERNPNNKGQRYGGYSAEDYIQKVMGCLPRVRALSTQNGGVSPEFVRGNGGYFNSYLDNISASLYGRSPMSETPGFDGKYGPRGQWKPVTSNPDDGRYTPNRGSQDKQVSVGPPKNFPTSGNVTLEYKILGTEQGNGGPGTYGQLFVNGKYFSDAHRTLANGAEKNVGKTVPIHWNPSGKIIGTTKSTDNWKSYRENYIREKYGDQAVRAGRMPGMDEGSGTGGNRIHAGTDSSWSEGCLIVGYNDRGKTTMNTTDSFATWWSLYQGLDALDKNGGKAKLKMTDGTGNKESVNPTKTKNKPLFNAPWNDAGDASNESKIVSSMVPKVPRATIDADSVKVSQPHLPVVKPTNDDAEATLISTNKDNSGSATRSAPVVIAPQTTNNGGNTTINNNTVNNYNIHNDDAARAELA